MKNIKFTVPIITVIVIIIILMYNQRSPALSHSPITIDVARGSQMYTNGEHIYIYNDSGIKILKGNTLITEDAFNLENPYIVSSFDKVAIGDKNGKVVRVYSKNGRMYTVNAPSDILGFTVNKNGFLGIILNSSSTYSIEFYNSTGENIYSIKDIGYSEGVPVSLSISNDNEVVAVSHINTMGAIVDSNISFYSINTNKVFSGFIKQNQYVSIVKFLNNNTLVGVSNKEIFNIQIDITKTPPVSTEIQSRALNNIITHINFLDDVGYTVAYGEQISIPIDATNEIIENTVTFYTQVGGKISNYHSNFNIEHIYSNNYGAILSSGKTFTAINPSSRELWQYSALQDIKSIALYENINQAVILTNNQIKISKMNSQDAINKLNNININENTTNNTENTTNTTENTMSDSVNTTNDNID